MARCERYVTPLSKRRVTVGSDAVLAKAGASAASPEKTDNDATRAIKGATMNQAETLGSQTVLSQEVSFADLPESLDGLPVLVTGGAGFIGSRLTRALLVGGAHVTVLDDFFTGRSENLPQSDRLRIVEGSVTDATIVRKLVTDANVVFHLAARNIIVSSQDPKSDFLVNAGGTLNLLLAIRELARPSIRMVYASSASIYGNARHLPIGEEDGTTCLSHYAASKRSGELYCHVFYEQHELPVSTVRYSNIYGIGQSPANPYCGVVSKFLVSAQHGEEILVHGDGHQTRDYTYVDDAVSATVLAAMSEKAEGEIFNIGSGIETSVLDLVAALSQLYDHPLDVRHIERRDIDNVRRRVMNIEKVRRRLRWIPSVRLEEGLRRTKEWIQHTAVAEATDKPQR